MLLRNRNNSDGLNLNISSNIAIPSFWPCSSRWK